LEEVLGPGHELASVGGVGPEAPPSCRVPAQYLTQLLSTPYGLRR
jgi:hypothetical protein